MGFVTFYGGGPQEYIIDLNRLNGVLSEIVPPLIASSL